MKILIVDDDPETAQRLAGEVGATGVGECFAAAGAEGAVRWVNAQGGIDLLVTDVFLAEADGPTLDETLRAHFPDLLTIFVTAYDFSEYAARIGGRPVLVKPVDAAALAEEIARQLPATPEPEAPDLLAGTTRGAYRIGAVIGGDREGPVYEAEQITIGRPVELHTLAAARAGDPSEGERFLANARAKASVHHPALLSVFEAGEADGMYFYASETRQGASLAELGAQRAQLTAAILLQLLHTIAEVMVHLGQIKTPHEPLRAEHVIVDHRSRARVVNLATAEPMTHAARDDMRSLAAAVAPVVLPHPSSGALQQLLADMEAGALTVRSWTALIYEVKRCAGAGSPPGYHLDAGGRAEIAAVGAARKRHRARRGRLVILWLVVLAAAAAAAWFFWSGQIPPWHK